MTASESTNNKHIFYPLDIVVLVFSITISIVLFFYSVSGNYSSPQVEIKSASDVYIYSLDEERAVVIQGPLGETTINIKKGEVSVEDSPGRQKICVKSGPISQNGQWLACLPNKVFLRIIGKGKSAENDKKTIDALTF